jgi:hypothetical protein
VASVRSPQRLTLADGTFFPLGCCAVPWGHASGPAGLGPKALEECVYSFKVSSAASVVVRGVGFSRHWRSSQPASVVPCAHMTRVCVWRISRRCSRVSIPRAWAHSRQSGRALRLAHAPPCRPSAGRGGGGEVSMTPIERVANRTILVKLLSSDPSGHPCPVP